LVGSDTVAGKHDQKRTCGEGLASNNLIPDCPGVKELEGIEVVPLKGGPYRKEGVTLGKETRSFGR